MGYAASTGYRGVLCGAVIAGLMLCPSVSLSGSPAYFGYVPNAGTNTVSVINSSTNTLLTKLGEIITSPFTTRVKKIVVDADPESVGKWKSFTRDVYDDYKRAFGEEPTRISGIAIMVDTDNTGEKANARFGDITLSARP